MKRIYLYYELLYVKGKKHYLCPACLHLYSDKDQAINCCPNEKPWTPLKASLAALAATFKPKAKRLRHKDNPLYGLRLPGYLNYWFKGLSHLKYLTAVYSKAQLRIACQATREQIDALETIYPTPPAPAPPPRSTLQKMAFAWHLSSWNQLRNLTINTQSQTEHILSDLHAIFHKYQHDPPALSTALAKYLGITDPAPPDIKITDIIISIKAAKGGEK